MCYTEEYPCRKWSGQRKKAKDKKKKFLVEVLVFWYSLDDKSVPTGPWISLIPLLCYIGHDKGTVDIFILVIRKPGANSSSGGNLGNFDFFQIFSFLTNKNSNR